MENKEELLYKDDHLDSKEYKCKNCGGRMIFSPSKQCLVCEFCSSEQQITLSGIVSERSIQELLEGGTVDNDSDVFSCPSCGAKTVVSKRDISVKCPFCGNNNTVKLDDIQGLQPQGIVTFKIEKKTAIENATTWAKKRLMAPRKFKKNVDPKNVGGLYNPLFTFDAETESSYHGRLGRYYTETYRDSQGNTRTRTKIRYFSVSGSLDGNFDDLLIPASEQITRRYLEEIEPFSTNFAISYEPKLLVGYTASTNTKPGDLCWNQAQREIDARIRDAILSKYNYDIVDFLNVKTTHIEDSYKYVLVPLYVGNYHYNKKVYNFFVNGENGKVSGKTPISPLKVLLIVLIVMTIIGTIVYFSVF